KEVGGALASLSGPADLAVVELRAWLNDAAAILPSERSPRRGCSVGPMERYFRGLFHSHVHTVRLSLSKTAFEDAARVGNDRCGSVDGPNGVYGFGHRRADCRSAHGPDGWHCHCRLFGPDY